MATYVKWADTIVDDSGIVIPSVTVTVKDPDTGDSITIYSDRAGTTKDNPFTTGVDGIAEFYVDIETNPRIKIELSKTDYDFTAANEMLNDVYLASKGETLGSLSDVTISSPVNDDVLTYDSGTGRWINRDPKSAMGVRNAAEFPGADIGEKINNAQEGFSGIVLIPAGTYDFSTTIVVRKNIQLIGAGSGHWGNGTRLHYTGTGTAITFQSVTAGASIKGVYVYTNEEDANYQSWIGIDVNRGEDITIEDVRIKGADIGFDVTGTLGAVYLARFIDISATDCKNEGIYFRSTGSFKNAVLIRPCDISWNNIGIRVAAGSGNIIEGGASEFGGNISEAILVEGGQWTITGPLWIENTESGIGIKCTGGVVLLGDDIHADERFVEDGGVIERVSLHQIYKEPQITGLNDQDLVCWFSFDEGSGTKSISKGRSTEEASFDAEPTWNPPGERGFFGSVVYGERATLANDILDWTQDWALLVVAKTNGTQQRLLLVEQGDTKFIVDLYPDGFQIRNESGFLANLSCFADFFNQFCWGILQYSSSEGKLYAYSASGLRVTSYSYTMPANLSTPDNVEINPLGLMYIDEFALYSRQLSQKEIFSITSLRFPPGNVLTTPKIAALGDLTDVTITSPADNELLAYDPGSGKWINQTPSEAGIIAADGSVPLSADWDIGDTRKILADQIQARDAAGLKLTDDAGNGIFLADGGGVGVGRAYSDHGGYGNAIDLQGGITLNTSLSQNAYLLADFDRDTGNPLASIFRGGYDTTDGGPLIFWHRIEDRDIQFRVTDSGGTTQTGMRILGSGAIEMYHGLDVTGDIHCTGKLTSDGGNDPPYVLYNYESRTSIINRVKNEVLPDKLNGAVLFFNGDRGQLELFLPSKGEFRALDGKVLKTVEPITQTCETEDRYYLDEETGEIKSYKVRKPTRKYRLKPDHELDHKTGKIKRKIKEKKKDPKTGEEIEEIVGEEEVAPEEAIDLVEEDGG